MIDATGCHVPADADVVAGLQAAYRNIYGQDIRFDSGDQDTQWLGIIASAIGDANAMTLAVYNSYSPATAQGVGLSSVVKTNGITRKVASYSTQPVTVIGQAGIPMVNQTVGDGTQAWTLPTPFTIPSSGTVDVTATCTVLGAVVVGQGMAGAILQPTRGLQSITFTGVTAPGQPVETDAQLRVRQGQSTTLPALGLADGIAGAILDLPNVARARVYDNDTATTDARGIPGHSISAVVDGGDNTAIATVIALRKGEAGTYGTASGIVPSGAAQIPRTIYFFRPTEPPITVVIAVKALSGFTTDVQNAIQSAVVAWINALGIGDGTLGQIDIGRIYGPALLSGTVFASTFTITSITIARDSGTPGPNPVPIAFNEAPQASTQTVTMAVS